MRMICIGAVVLATCPARDCGALEARRASRATPVQYIHSATLARQTLPEGAANIVGVLYRFAGHTQFGLRTQIEEDTSQGVTRAPGGGISMRPNQYGGCADNSRYRVHRSSALRARLRPSTQSCRYDSRAEQGVGPYASAGEYSGRLANARRSCLPLSELGTGRHDEARTRRKRS
jgi:hypothetical protein